MKNIFSILSALMFLVSAHVASFGNICIDDDGLHVDVSEQHGCCESEAAETHCDEDDGCFDLALHLDFSRQSYPNEGPQVSLVQISVEIISYEEFLPRSLRDIATDDEVSCSTSSPLAAIRSIQLLV